MGINKWKSKASDVLFWIGMASQIEDFISKCSICRGISEGTEQRTNDRN